ncbi:unnamed protein product [Heterotrigona itama]|uniref:Uncharacterized protein n=1 Tax=Heterotrigona itama TaxID=395501 RepID=A0A6V7H2N8_9HYME|nr:unnamed protein product [Heterotrigona itama]
MTVIEVFISRMIEVLRHPRDRERKSLFRVDPLLLQATTTSAQHRHHHLPGSSVTDRLHLQNGTSSLLPVSPSRMLVDLVAVGLPQRALRGHSIDLSPIRETDNTVHGDAGFYSASLYASLYLRLTLFIIINGVRLGECLWTGHACLTLQNDRLRSMSRPKAIDSIVIAGVALLKGEERAGAQGCAYAGNGACAGDATEKLGATAEP